MYEDVLKTLLLPFETGVLDWPDAPVLLINGRPDNRLPDGIMVQQYFRVPQPAIVAEIPEGARFDLVLVCAGKQHDEARYDIARALAHLNDGGMIVCAGTNDGGGRRIVTDFGECGLEDTGEISKHKCRVAWALKQGHEKPGWLTLGDMRAVLDGAFLSRPGIFGWDKIDTGSALLTTHLPDGALAGKGADFGCGYGYLARHIVQHNNIDALFCLDADYRAVEACRENLGAHNNVYYEWTDLTRPQENLPKMNWVVMNPPFHEGKKAQYSIGTDFIKTAADVLKPGGDLWMVANAHLPYETVLEICFRSFEKVTEEEGFKVFHAKR